VATKIQEGNGSDDEQSRKSKRPRPVTVEIIERQGKSVLIAWMEEGQYRRAFCPANRLAGNEVDADVLEKCPLYGVNWAQKFNLPDSDLLANELRRQGIWTADDFKRGRAKVLGAIQRVLINPLIEELVKEL